MFKKLTHATLPKKGIGKLLDEQTKTILSAVDGRLEKFETRFDAVDKRFEKIDGRFEKIDGRFEKIDGTLDKFETRFDAIDERLEKQEMRFNKKLDQLMTTLDRFLKRLTDSEDEFLILKKDVNHIKTVLKEKLGVNLF